ncbi:F-box domain-containing protein [Mycena sanguinolenta]|uniref:F-box domain-containing protein n=1 Tax=Mycena sanguinolenta TaxID=230812 RepID=A0A8H7D2Z1_9AGAR|nr:F-box domain-containing protein [Mycena sanguinolenta]
MPLTAASILEAVHEQTQRTKHCSKADIERFIEESESKILSLKSRISALIELRDSERACVLALRYLVSPIRTLPVELLAKIFDLAIEGGYRYITHAHRISQVCSHWRQVALGTPRLWTRYLDVNLYDKGENAADGLKAWLARSAPLPLSISLVLHSKSNPAILEEVLRVASRLGYLQVLLGSGITVSTPPSFLAAQLGQCTLDSLEELDLGTIEEYEDCTPLDFTTARRLRKFRITKLGCPNLVTARITIPEESGPAEVGRNTPVQFNQLQSLHLSADVHPDSQTEVLITPIFDYFSSPVLQELKLQLPRTHCTQPHFTAFQLRAPNITRLEFAYTDLFTLAAVIRHAPFVTHLTLTCCDKYFDDAAIRSLYYEEGVAPLIPHLHTLVVKTRVVNFAEDILGGNDRVSLVLWFFNSVHQEYHLGPRFTDIVKDIPSDVLVYAK